MLADYPEMDQVVFEAHYFDVSNDMHAYMSCCVGTVN